MSNIILEGPIAEVREREVRLLQAVAELVAQVNGDGSAEDKQRLQQNAADLQDMFFLVVVVGEFNAGKSTFVNALLGDEILPMGITPTTDAIELVRWFPKKQKDYAWREPGIVREWLHPHVGVPGVVIVDTPGTGSVFRKHERIAKDFLSRSDLVIFLLSAKRAFAETERLYLELAQNYGKKVVVVINQSDLLNRGERKDVQAFVQQQLREKLDLQPDIFMVSAREALKKQKGVTDLFSGAAQDPGDMNALREHLRAIFGRVPPAKQKLYTQLDFVDKVIQRHIMLLEQRIALVTSDTALEGSLRRGLAQQTVSLNEPLALAKREVGRVFEDIKARAKRDVQPNLSIERAAKTQDRDEMRQK
ncbi:MAG: dynamin family protein, partial [Anaerolineae bacterium]|nr:dynamin family protein [Anaerolineae bacterium]